MEYKVGDVLRLWLDNGVVNSWKIEGFFHGGLGQESIVQIKSLGIKPPLVYDNEVSMYIPANLVNKAVKNGLLTVYKPDK